LIDKTTQNRESIASANVMSLFQRKRLPQASKHKNGEKSIEGV